MSKTHGPRLNRERAREVVEKLGLRVIQSDGHGILIRRSTGTMRPKMIFGSYHEQEWRVYTGGGIAGNSDSAWIAPVRRDLHGEPRGPYWNKRQLENALREWRRWEGIFASW